MPFTFTDEEYAPLAGLPVETIVDLAAELDLLVPETIDRRALLHDAVVALVAHAADNGLPFSKYDADDLAALSSEDLAAIADLQGTRPSVRAVLKQGQRVYKTYASKRIDHPIPLMLPMLLTAVARAARLR
jgi:hypothetical protein